MSAAWKRLVIAAAVVGLAVCALNFAGARPADPLAAEIQRWSAFVRDHAGGDETWEQVKASAQPFLARADQALREGRRYAALYRLAAVRVNLSATDYFDHLRPEALRDSAGFVAEWRRAGAELGTWLDPPQAATLADVAPAAVRAFAEAALLQIRAFYEASPDYAYNTEPRYGLFYIGQARAQRELVTLCRSMSATSKPAPPLHPLDAELDSLESEVLAAYRPPTSIDRHPEFITVSSTIKEARELNAAGLRYGAMLRYLQAEMRFAPLRTPVPIDRATLDRRIAEFESRVDGGAVDGSLGRIFVELAEAERTGAAPDSVPPIAAAIVTHTLPRYFAALAPAAAAPPRPTPQVTVTLVRWPYT
jgi:hypothetical protein